MVQAESLCGKFQTGTVRVNGTNFDSVKQVSENVMSRKVELHFNRVGRRLGRNAIFDQFRATITQVNRFVVSKIS